MSNKSPKQKTLADSGKRQGAYLAMVLPGALFLLAFCYLPMPGIVLAFKKYQMTVPTADSFFKNIFLNSLVKSEWNGLNNFTYLLPTLTVKEKERAEKPGEQGIFGSRTKERMLHVKRSG